MRYHIPNFDQPVGKSWWQEELTLLQNAKYVATFFVDLILRDLLVVWSSILKRNVRQPERFQATALTESEMFRRNVYKKQKLISEMCNEYYSCRNRKYLHAKFGTK